MYGKACESAKSNALMRCCKDLGIASELRMPQVGELFVSHNLGKPNLCVSVSLFLFLSLSLSLSPSFSPFPPSHPSLFVCLSHFLILLIFYHVSFLFFSHHFVFLPLFSSLLSGRRNMLRPFGVSTKRQVKRRSFGARRN